MKVINIVIIGTNAYFALAIRFIKRFHHFYKGDGRIVFHLFTDKDPQDYLTSGIDVRVKYCKHEHWQDGTNSKFDNILSLGDKVFPTSYIYYFDADTNIVRDFTDDWFLGDTVAGEHYANRDWMKDKKNYDRNPRSMAYVPTDTKLPQMYFYGAFFGGRADKVLEYCKILKDLQLTDREWGYEPEVNDESYINCYFHFHPPSKIVKTEDFQFEISDKGGIRETRKTNLDIDSILTDLKYKKEELIDIRYGVVL